MTSGVLRLAYCSSQPTVHRLREKGKGRMGKSQMKGVKQVRFFPYCAWRVLLRGGAEVKGMDGDREMLRHWLRTGETLLLREHTCGACRALL